MKLQEPGCLLPGEAGYWRSDLDLWCRLHPLSQGVVPYSGDSSQDLLVSSSWEALWHLKLDHPSCRCRMALAMAWTSSRCHSWTCLTALSTVWSCSLTRASSQTFSLSLGDHEGVGLLHHLRVCIFFCYFTEALGVSNVTLLKL